MIFVDKHPVSLMEFSNSSLLISTKIGFTRPPNLGGSAINFLSILLKTTTPVIRVMNSDCTTLSKRLSYVVAPEIIRMWKKKFVSEACNERTIRCL